MAMTPLSLVALIAFVLFFWCPGATATGSARIAEPTQLAIGQKVPAVRLNGLNSASRSLSDYAGRPLIINVWASWCGPCKAEAASLERLAWSESGQVFAVIGISTDDERGAAQRWLTQSNATLSHFIDSGQQLERLLGASRIPLTVLVDAKGCLRARFQGARAWDSAESVKDLQRALRSPLRPEAC
jgi:thiol-disulfide isomerase/thioredoxin